MNDNRMNPVDQDLMAIDARLEFRRMRQMIARLFLGKRQTSLLTLDHYRDSRKIINKQKMGTQAIPVQQIKGSVTGYADYDADFYPQYGTREVWTRRYLARLNGDSAPAIKVVKVDDSYFVEEGHIDVSIARVMGQGYIDAQITEIELEAASPQTTQPMPEKRVTGSFEVEGRQLFES